MSVSDSARGAAGMVCGFTRSKQMVRVRRAVPTAKCSVRDRQNASGHGYTSELKKYERVKSDIEDTRLSRSDMSAGTAECRAGVPESH